MSATETKEVATADAQSTKASFDQCIKLLKGPQDEHKFVGLLMVSKLFSSMNASQADGSGNENPELAGLRSQILEALGLPFLKRLLMTSDTERVRARYVETEALGAIQNEQVSMYQALAVNMISSFCRDQSMFKPYFLDADIVSQTLSLSHNVCLALEDVLRDARTSRQPNATLDTMLTSWSTFLLDSIDIIESLASFSEGVELLNSIQAPVSLLNSLLCTVHVGEGSVGSEVKAQDSAIDGAEGEHKEVPPTADVIEKVGQFRVRSAILLQPLLAGNGSLGAEGLGTGFFQSLFSLFAMDQTPVKFYALSILLHIFSSSGDHFPTALSEIFQSANAAQAATSQLRSGLFQLLRSRIPGEQRRSVLSLVYLLLSMLGPSWLLELSPSQHVAAVPSADGTEGHQFITILAKLAAIEVKLLLDDVNFAFFDRTDESRAKFDSDPGFRHHVEGQLELLSTCLGILEQVIVALTSMADAQDDLIPAERLLQIRESLVGVSDVIVEYYTSCSLALEGKLFTTETARPGLDALIMTSIVIPTRFIGLWLAEDADALDKYGFKVFSFLLKLPEVYVKVDGDAHQRQDHQQDLSPAKLDILPFLLPAMFQLSITENSLGSLVKCGGLWRALTYCLTKLKTLNAVHRHPVEGNPLPEAGILVTASAILMNTLVLGADPLVEADDPTEEMVPLCAHPSLGRSVAPLLMASITLSELIKNESAGSEDLVQLWAQLVVIVLIVVRGSDDADIVRSTKESGLDEMKLKDMFGYFFSLPPSKIGGEELSDLRELASCVGSSCFEKLPFLVNFLDMP